MKFKIFDTKNKKFVEDIKYYLLDGEIFIPGLITSGGNAEVIMFKQNHLIPIYSTGLKDKNGKEIFGGDILKENHFEMQFEVRKVDGCYLWGQDYLKQWIHTIEIIGSKYTSPELLEK